MAYIKHRPSRPKPWLVCWQDPDGRERSKATRTKAEAEQYVGVIESGREGASGATLWQAVQHWLGETEATCRPATYVHYRYAGRKALDHIGRTVKVASLTPQTWAQYRDALAANLHAKTVNNHLRAMRALMSYCERRGWVTVNTVKAVKFPRYRSKIPRWLDDAESQRLVDALGCAPWDIRLALLLALRAGMRLGDLTALRWADVQYDAIHVNEGKSKQPRMVPIHADVAAALLTADRRGEYVFYNRIDYERHRHSDLFGRRLTKWLKHNGFEGVHTHSLRHTFCSALARAGASLHDIRQLAGHVSVETTEIYLHSAQTHQADLIRRLGCSDQGLRVLASGSER
jgi:site-specific recombinase XerD